MKSMKKKFFQNPLKIRNPKLALACMLPLAFVMCRNYEKHVERNRLDNEISQVKQEMRTNKNLHTVRVPQKLRGTQIRYNNATDSVNKNADTMDWCMNQNDSLLIRAYNNYAERVGRDFQMSVFLPDSDIAVYQKYVSQLNSFDSVDMTIEHARRRILNNTASLNDVSLFFEYMPDSINHELRNPLGWNFYMDTTNDDTLEMSVYGFTDSVLFGALKNEKNLLNNAWIKNDSVGIDTNDVFGFFVNYFSPNFSIPEFDSVQNQYKQNDSIIKSYTQYYATMSGAEDSLHNYYQDSMNATLDSLITQRNALEK